MSQEVKQAHRVRTGAAKAVSGIRAMRDRLSKENPDMKAAIGIEAEAEQFCQEVRAGLRDERKKQGIDQSKLAESLDLTQSAISKIEGGQGDLGVKTVFRYAHALGLRPICIFVPTAGRLFQFAREGGVGGLKTMITPHAAQAFAQAQVNLVRQTCSNVSNAMTWFVHGIK
jgi:transcriptional regulator with XRE-family HTH domain